jgi:hypothetical protein
VTTRDVEWDEQQQALMLALAEYRSMSCEGCGGWLPDTTADGVDATDFEVPGPMKCHQCVAISIHAEAFAKNGKQPHLARWRAKRKKVRR